MKRKKEKLNKTGGKKKVNREYGTLRIPVNIKGKKKDEKRLEKPEE